MTKKWFNILITALLIFTLTLNSFVVFADEETEVSETGENGENGETGDGTEIGENPDVPQGEEAAKGVNPVKNNKGASQSLEGFELVSPNSDDKNNLDLYFNKEEISFKIVKNNPDGSKYVWSSQLSPKDLGIDETISGSEGMSAEELAAAERDRINKIHPYDRQSMSLMLLTYVNLGNTINSNLYSTSSYSQPHRIYDDKVDYTGTGVSLAIEFTELNIRVPLIVEINGQELNVRIPNDSIYENTQGAENVRTANDEMEEDMKEISKLIVAVRKMIKNEDERKIVDSYLNDLANKLKEVRESVITGMDKSTKPEDISKDVKMLEENCRRQGFYDKYPNLKEAVEKIVEYTDKSMDNYTIISGQKVNGLYSVSVMPFLGTGTTTEEGYVFYPDGAGAISKFNVLHPTLIGHYEQPIYSSHELAADYSLFYEQNIPAIYPVFGVNKGKNGFVGIITEGDADAKLEYWPGNTDYTLGRIFSTFMYRRKVKYYRSNSVSEVFDIKRIQTDRNIKYKFLEEENSDYSGMAIAFRDYLKDNDLLNKAVDEGDDMPLVVDFLMGAKEQGIFGKSTIVMTEYQAAEELLKRAREDGVTGKIYSNLYNWTKTDAVPNKYDADNALGGKNGLKSLAEYANNNNIILGLSMDPVGAQRKFATSDQIKNYYIKDSYGLSIEYKSDSGGFYYTYFSPQYIKDKYASSIISKIKSFGANAAQINMVGERLYYDYSKYYSMDVSREDTKNIFRDVVKMSNDELGNSSVYYGNMYVWKYASRIDSMPLSDTEFLYSDQSVPFLQIILHGNIPYTGYYPYNIMYDKKKQMLEYVEFGCMPTFFLTEEKISKLQFSIQSWNYEWLYTSDIESWYDEMITVYKEFSENFGYLWSQEIVDHKELQSKVKRVEYADGSIIYVNYNDDKVEFTDSETKEKVTVEAMGYLVRRGK